MDVEVPLLEPFAKNGIACQEGTEMGHTVVCSEEMNPEMGTGGMVEPLIARCAGFPCGRDGFNARTSSGFYAYRALRQTVRSAHLGVR